MKRGPFIALEGIDGAGKSTQCREAADYLRGRGFAVTQCADPGGTSLGDQLRTMILGGQCAMGQVAESLLFMASRAELVERVIRPALESGAAVVTDRFLLSNIVYQGRAGGLDTEELWRLALFATGGLEPDVNIVLDATVERTVGRRKPQEDRIEQRGVSYQETVRQGFLAEARSRPERIRVVDASRSFKAVRTDIVAEVERVLEARARS